MTQGVSASSFWWSTRCGLSWERVDGSEGHVLPAAEPWGPGVYQVPPPVPAHKLDSVIRTDPAEDHGELGGQGDIKHSTGPKSTSTFK